MVRRHGCIAPAGVFKPKRIKSLRRLLLNEVMNDDGREKHEVVGQTYLYFNNHCIDVLPTEYCSRPLRIGERKLCSCSIKHIVLGRGWLRLVPPNHACNSYALRHRWACVLFPQQRNLYLGRRKETAQKGHQHFLTCRYHRIYILLDFQLCYPHRSGDLTRA